MQVARSRHIVIRKSKQKHGAVVTHGKPSNLLAHLRVHDVYQLVSRPVALHLQRRRFVAQILLESLSRAKNKFANPRMKPVCTHDEIEITRPSALKGYMNVFFGLFDALHANPPKIVSTLPSIVAENCCREVSSRKADIAVPRYPRKRVDGKPRYPFPAAVNNPDFPRQISSTPDLRQQAHAVCDVETCAPEVNEVAAAAQARCRFNDGGLESITGQPVCKRGSCNARARYQDFHHEK